MLLPFLTQINSTFDCLFFACSTIYHHLCIPSFTLLAVHILLYEHLLMSCIHKFHCIVLVCKDKKPNETKIVCIRHAFHNTVAKSQHSLKMNCIFSLFCPTPTQSIYILYGLIIYIHQWKQGIEMMNLLWDKDHVTCAILFSCGQVELGWQVGREKYQWPSYRRYSWELHCDLKGMRYGGVDLPGEGTRWWALD